MPERTEEMDVDRRRPVESGRPAEGKWGDVGEARV